MSIPNSSFEGHCESESPAFFSNVHVFEQSGQTDETSIILPSVGLARMLKLFLGYEAAHDDESEMKRMKRHQ